MRTNHNFLWRDSLGITMGTETSKESSSSHGWSNHSQPYTTDVAAFEAEQIKMREISRMDQTIRSRLHQGVKYNMKVLLCGERGTGKTMLWRRLQGQPFSYEVSATSVKSTSPSRSLLCQTFSTSSFNSMKAPLKYRYSNNTLKLAEASQFLPLSNTSPTECDYQLDLSPIKPHSCWQGRCSEGGSMGCGGPSDSGG